MLLSKIVFAVESQKEMDGIASKSTDYDLNREGSQLKFDGPEKYVPKQADVLLCVAIIQGYAAVRCPNKGVLRKEMYFFLLHSLLANTGPQQYYKWIGLHSH